MSFNRIQMGEDVSDIMPKNIDDCMFPKDIMDSINEYASSDDVTDMPEMPNSAYNHEYLHDLYNRPSEPIIPKRTHNNAPKKNDVDMYSLISDLPETKISYAEMRDRSVLKMIEFVKKCINEIEQELVELDGTRFFHEKTIDVSEFGIYGISKIKNIIKWFYKQRSFSVKINGEKGTLKVKIIWGNFEFAE